MNRLLVEGNFYGGLVQGIGLALSEDFEDLNHDTTLKNCGIPYQRMLRMILNFISMKHIVQVVLTVRLVVVRLHWMLHHPAILNAIFNATGARITRIPARPEKGSCSIKGT